MILSKSYFYTLRENVKDEETKSSNLLARSGMIKKVSNGIYMYTPLGFRVLKKIENIVRDEMNKSGAQELLMPSLLPEDIYVTSGRRENFGKNMFGLKDRYERDYVLGPTHEELFAIAAGSMIHSYKDLPFNLYQIGRKYRDEPRPRFGLIRIREFIMKDAYSFDFNYVGLDKSYKIMYDTYVRIFDRIGINYRVVKADTGTMGGILSEEFQAITDVGEDILVLCPKCDYASNLEVSECIDIPKENDEEILSKELVYTPNVGTIEDVTNYLNLPASKFVKTLIYKIDGQFYACLVPGDRDINEVKLEKLLGSKEVEMASIEEVEEITASKVGFAGPIGLNIPIIIDNDIKYMKNYVVGANKSDYHYMNVNNNDFEYYLAGDIKNVKEGDKCPKCGASLYFNKGIEIGNIFKLGTKYSESLGLYYTDANNTLKPVVMGSYGIGLERIMVAVAEQSADDKGLVWPINIAPYEVAIVIIDPKNNTQLEIGHQLYNNLKNIGVDVILDDRDERPGVKFNDIDLIGIPIRITIGKKVHEDIVELKLRNGEINKEVNVKNIVNNVKELIM